MDKPSLSILLITTDDQFADDVREMLSGSVGAAEMVFVVERGTSTLLNAGVSFLQASKDETATPDVILFYTHDEPIITAVADQFPTIPIILITDKNDMQTSTSTQMPPVADILEREQLTPPLLKRVLMYVYQMRRHIIIKDKAREHRQIAEALLQAGVEMNAILDYESLLDTILLYAVQFFPYDLAAIMLVEGDEVRIERIQAANVDQSLQWALQKASHTVFSLKDTRNLREIVENGRYLIIPNVDEYPDWVHIKTDFRIGSWMGAPLTAQGQTLGILSLDSAKPNVYRDEYGRMLESFSAQAALALRNAHIHQRRQREIAELSALHAISQASTEAATVDELLTRCTHIVAEKLYPDSFGFVLLNDDGLTISAHPAFHNRLPVLHPDKLPRGTGVVGQVIETGQIRRVSDVRTNEEYEGIVAHTHSELCVPLKVGEQIIGAINAESILFEAFTDADERFMVALSQQLATGIERIQLLVIERQSREEATKLRDAAASLTSSLDLEQVFSNILRGLDEVVPHDSASVMLLHGDELTIMATRGFEYRDSLVGHSVSATNPFFTEVRQTKRPLYLPDTAKEPRFYNISGDFPIRSWICLPLIVREQVLGSLTIDNKQENAYGAVEIQFAQAFANQAAIAIDNARLYTAEQRARERAEIMREANSMMVQTLDMDTIFDILLDYLQKLVLFDSASVLFVEGDFAHIHLAKGIENWTDAAALKKVRINVLMNETFQEIMRTQRGLLISDVYQDGRWEIFESSKYVRSWVGVPLIAGGQFLGCFSIDKAVPGYFNEGHLELIENFTSQAAILIQNSQLFQETQQRAAELERITTLSAALRETVELERLLGVILRNVLQLVNGTFGGIYLIDSESGDLMLQATLPNTPSLIGLRQSIERGIVGFVARTGRIYIAPDFKTDPLLDAAPEEEILLKTLRTGINLPLWVQERVVGVLYVAMDRRHDFSDREVKLLTAVAEIAATAIDRAIVLDTLEQRIVARTRELAKANERLTELDRLKTKFVSDVSHELRTPTTNLSLYLDLLARGKPERREQYMAVLRQQVDRLTTMIEDILNISRLDMGKIKLHVIPININHLVQQVVESFEDKIDPELALSTQFQPNLPQILGDEKQIVLVLANLLNNAMDYTQTGSVRIATLWDEAHERVCIEVEDTGIGIPTRELDHVFERFYRASNVSQSTMPGTGLGLSFVKELVDMHHGDIEITSELNKGTRVALYLPVTVDSNQ
ncbi:MAG: GAF domain-containing protein [Anaerolineae bacterium]|nr:GAF domain-containing protein [Anaerolineae bacterium]